MLREPAESCGPDGLRERPFSGEWNRYALAVELYEPINTLKPVGEDLWLVDGPIVRMAYLRVSIPFPTRMVVVRLANGELFLWSPTEPDDDLRAGIDDLGPVRHLVSPNKIHYAHVAACKRAYPKATAWASPGVRERAASARPPRIETRPSGSRYEAPRAAPPSKDRD